MPRFRFNWSNISSRLLSSLCSHLRLSGDDSAAILRGAFGARPREDFVEQTWPVLLDHWLANDEGACASIAATLRERNVGNTAEPDDLAYLRSCRNTIGLRRVVLPEFIAMGELAHPESPSPDAPPSPGIGGPLQGRNRLGGDHPAPPAPDSDSSPDLTGDEANPVERLRQWALTTVREAFKDPSIEPDDEGDIGISRGSIVVYITPHDEPLRLEIYAVLLLDVPYSEQLLRTINSINVKLPFEKVQYIESQNMVIMTTQINASGLSESSLLEHLGNLSGAADYFDTQLHEQFGGRQIGEDRRPDEQIV